MTDVEKVARAIAQASVDDLEMFRGVNGQDAIDALMALSRKQAEAALAALGEEPVAWRWRYSGEKQWAHRKNKPDVWPDMEIEPLYAHPPRREAVEEAVKAERERCAAIAEQFNGQKHAAHDMATGVFPKQSYMGEVIAAAIRAGSEG